MSGAVPPFPQYVFMAWCLVKHWDNFTFPFKRQEDGESYIMRSLIICTLHHVTKHVARMGEMRYEYKILAGKPEGKRAFGALGNLYENNIKLDL
jgi:hypothetical protein